LLQLIDVHPYSRLLSAMLIAVAAFSTYRLGLIAGVYCVLGVGLCFAGLAQQHLRYVAMVTGPILVAPLVVWGLIAKAAPVSGVSGVEYALVTWLRISITGGAFQWLVLPLTERPILLRGFLDKLGIKGALATMIITPIIFVPEVRRRFLIIVDARKAQGHRASGLAGLLAIPTMLGPLVASLLDGALARAELWEHRDLLNADTQTLPKITYSSAHSAMLLTGALIALALVLQRWI
jgi:energy-coupling factor transporter transmembrane protein EcfT